VTREQFQLQAGMSCEFLSLESCRLGLLLSDDEEEFCKNSKQKLAWRASGKEEGGRHAERERTAAERRRRKKKENEGNRQRDDGD